MRGKATMRQRRRQGEEKHEPRLRLAIEVREGVLRCIVGRGGQLTMVAFCINGRTVVGMRGGGLPAVVSTTTTKTAIRRSPSAARLESPERRKRTDGRAEKLEWLRRRGGDGEEMEEDKLLRMRCSLESGNWAVPSTSTNP